MQRKGPAQPIRQPQPVAMSSGGGRSESNQRVEDLALEDLKDAINQVVLLQNVRGTLMDEIAQLKRRLSSQTDELNQIRSSAEETRSSTEAELNTLREKLSKAEAERLDAISKAGFAEEALAIAASEKEALAAHLEAVQCDVEALNKDNGDTAASLASRDTLLAEQLGRIGHLEDSLSKQADELRAAKEIEKKLMVEVEQAQTGAQAAQTQSEAVRKAEVDMLEKQQVKMQTENIRLNTELGLATARLQAAETAATQASKASAELESSVAELNEQLECKVEDSITAQQELAALRTELAQLKEAIDSQNDGSVVVPPSPRLSGRRTSISAPTSPMVASMRRADTSSIESELEAERNRANVFEAKLLKREAEAYALGGDREQLEDKIAALTASADSASAEISKLRAEVKVSASQRESLQEELRQASAKVSDLTAAKTSAEKDLSDALAQMHDVEASMVVAQQNEASLKRVQGELEAATSDIERLTAVSIAHEKMKAEHGALELQCATLQRELKEKSDDAQATVDAQARLKEDLSVAQSDLADCKRQLAASQAKRETDLQLLEQQKNHVEALLADARERVSKLEQNLKDARAESDAELERVKAKMDRLNSDYFETKAEAASLEKQSKEAARQLPQLQQELGDAKLSIGKLNFEVERLQEVCKVEEAKLLKVTADLDAEREAKKSLDEASTAAQAQITNLEQIVQQQQTHGRALVVQLESVGAVEARASQLEEANARLTAEVQAAQDELKAKAADYTATVEMMRTHAQEETDRHEQSHEGLVSMLETLKKELYAHTKKEVEMSQELGQKDHRLDDALKDVDRLTEQCESLSKETETLRAAVAQAERELAEAKEATEETAESAHIASALGSDTGLMRQLLEARQEVARLKKEVKDARCSSPKMGRAAPVDIKTKLQLSQAQAQAKTLKAENMKLKEQLEAAEKRLAEAQANVEEDL